MHHGKAQQCWLHTAVEYIKTEHYMVEVFIK